MGLRIGLFSGPPAPNLCPRQTVPIVTDKHVYVHMPKTGGTWLTGYLQGELEGRRVLQGHSSARDLDPEVIGDRKLFGTVRDPWSWYLSWYNHATRIHNAPGTPMYEYCGGRKPDFPTVLTNLLTRTNVPEYYNLIWRAPGALARRPEWMTSQVGLYSFWFDEIYGGLVTTLLNTARLHEAAEAFLGVSIDETKYPPKNTAAQITPNGPQDMSAYTPELIDLVWAHDGDLARKLNFSPRQASNLQPIIQLDIDPEE